MKTSLSRRRIVLGVTGSIAVYKAADLASKLSQSGAIVDVILTESATKFISPLTFQSVTGRKAYTEHDLWGGDGHVVHIELGHAADLVLIAPASANTIASLAHGIANNLLTVTTLAASCPVVIAPAMDGGMYDNPATQANIQALKDRNFLFLGPVEGHLASGLVGPGRFMEPAEILGHTRYILGRQGSWKGKKVVVTAGGTREAIDPVRVITNRSSGKQGIAIAQAAIDRGADVTLISTSDIKPPAGAKVINVVSAADMHKAVIDSTKGTFLLVMAAAVADFAPKKSSTEKIKKETGIPVIKLEATQDILKSIAAQRAQIGYPAHVIGFAAESENLLQNAQKKLESKNLDLIVANDISQPGIGFESDNNQVYFVLPNREPMKIPLTTKTMVAEKILDQVELWDNK